ncbi:MAG: UrcA family protein [Erythrobacter sp.]
MKKTLAALAAIGLAASAVSAQAGGVKVAFDDLDLSTTKGQKTLDRRIDKAARAICGLDEVRLGSRIRDKEAAACFKEAKAKSRAQVAAVIERDSKGG